ncbi:unnamed protein product [Linum trigynum]|uniref:Retrotransposon Copia-like N-terminal domain-containing protein n=1 Tax=Linum trigynum TaxID=586398 RepID=A0AAV2CZQ6_9ROSI
MTGGSAISDSSKGSTSSEIQIITFNPAAQLPLKFTPSNFASWRSQLETLLMGLDLIGYLDGTTTAPPQSITIDEASMANPAYRNWFRQDKLILHAMRCSIDESIYSFVSAASTAREAWLTLEKLYASSAQSRVIHLKGKLAKSIKGDRDILTFINDLKSTAAELALIGEPVKDIDLIVHCLRGLSEDYQAFAAAVRSRGPGLSLEDLVDSMVEFEADIKARPQITVPTAFSSQGQKQGGSPQSRPHRGGASSQPYFAGSSPRGPPSPSRQLFSGPASPRENSSPLPRRPRQVCQYCEKPGHTVHQCFRLFPQARQAHLQTRQAQAHYSNAGSSIPQSTTSPSNPWLMDSAASHHVTADLGNLSLYSDYTGPDELVVGNGSGL